MEEGKDERKKRTIRIDLDEYPSDRDSEIERPDRRRATISLKTYRYPCVLTLNPHCRLPPHSPRSPLSLLLKPPPTQPPTTLWHYPAHLASNNADEKAPRQLLKKSTSRFRRTFIKFRLFRLVTLSILGLRNTLLSAHLVRPLRQP